MPKKTSKKYQNFFEKTTKICFGKKSLKNNKKVIWKESAQNEKNYKSIGATGN